MSMAALSRARTQHRHGSDAKRLQSKAASYVPDGIVSQARPLTLLNADFWPILQNRDCRGTDKDEQRVDLSRKDHRIDLKIMNHAAVLEGGKPRVIENAEGD